MESDSHGEAEIVRWPLLTKEPAKERHSAFFRHGDVMAPSGQEGMASGERVGSPPMRLPRFDFPDRTAKNLNHDCHVGPSDDH